MRFAIVGGTFDPPHVVHLVVGEVAYQQLNVDRVLFIPAGEPWQKSPGRVTPAAHRLEMVRRATARVPYFEVDDREIRRAGPSYTAVTIGELRSEGHDPVLVLGGDAAAGMGTWREAGGLSDVEVAVVERPGTDRASVEESVIGRLTWLDAPRLEVSATELRQRARDGHSLRFIVPDAVSRYIVNEGVYA